MDYTDVMSIRAEASGNRKEEKKMANTEKCRIVLEGGVGQIEEKKSKFIASVFPAGTEEEAAALIGQTRKKYWDARHHCTAYVIGEQENPLMRCSDDGEPAQTAGRPMLDVLTGEGLRNALVVVTRYFGGTLLGTGGLVRAYSGAVREGLKNSVLVEKRRGIIYDVRTDYADLGKLSYLCARRQVAVLETSYADSAVSRLVLPPSTEREFFRELAEATSACAKAEKKQDICYALHGGELILFTENGSVRDRIRSQSPQAFP
jgi:uncharacterized YigZ family protein